MIKSLYKFILLLILFNFINLQESSTKLNLDEIVSGKLEKDGSLDYYILNLPDYIPENNLLVFTAEENKVSLNKEEEIFSDPDIYISKKKFAPNKEQSDWYSERFGNDIITISYEELKLIDKLYISLFCEKKCKYNLKAYLTKEIEFKLGVINSIRLSKHNSINYYLKINRDKFNLLKIVAYSPSKKHFHLLMTKGDVTPSTQNTIKAIPFFFGGYMINIEKSSPYFCKNCTYHILFQTEEDNSKINFYAFYQDTFTLINSGQTLFDSIEYNSKRCYYYDLKGNYFLDNNNLNIIVQMTLFGGEAYLHFSGYNKIIYKNNKEIKKLKNYGFNIISEKSILIDKNDLNKFEKEYDIKIEGEKNKIYFCVYGLEKGSYILNVNNLNGISGIQKYNYLFPGYNINGYLAGNQITSYQVMDNNLNKNTNITISLKNLEGKAKLYGYFCDSENDLFCGFGLYKLQSKLESKEMIFPRSESSLDQTIFIDNDSNYCHSKKHGKECTLLTVIQCISNVSEICSFSLMTQITDIPIIMSPRKTYYNFISSGKNDLYEISIKDKSINNLVIVLSTNIGNAELKLESKINNDLNLIRISKNEYDLPDVIRLNPEHLNKKDLIGEYLVTVYSKYFSSYNLYYYTTKLKKSDKKNKITEKDITSTLIEGQIIKDYFPSNLNCKIYYYSPQDKSKKDIKITLTRINIRFTFYVFLNLKDIKFNDNIISIYDERISGYKWSSDTNNEITISKDDKNYRKKGDYYIVVLPDLTTDIDNAEKIEEKIPLIYYIGITKEGIPFYLKEGIEHSVTLNNNYLMQAYVYTHYNLNKDFQIVINMLNGKVDIFISNKELNKDDIKNINERINNSTRMKMNLDYDSINILVQKGISDYASIILDKNYFYKYNINNGIINTNRLDIFIYILQSPFSIKFNRDSQYIITTKNSYNKASILLSGHVYKNKLKVNTEEYFIIEEVKHRDSLTLTAKFDHGGGDIYVKLIDNNEEMKLKNINFPNMTNFDYSGNSIYMGKMIQIPGEKFDKIGKSITRIKILITVFVKSYVKDDKSEIEYTLSFSNEAKRINQNIPYHNSIRSGEFQYYTFYFDKTTQNILISLSNMNGDADLFLNYGNEIFPTPIENDWSSTGLGHEYIDININDKFFKNNNINTLGGYYTLLVVGYSNTTYTLFISSHDEYIFRLMDNTALNCKCDTKDDKCYFRYDNVAKKIGLFENLLNNETLIKSTEIIFTSQYLYGSGKMYASIIKEQDIYNNPEKNKKYIDYFPSKNKSEFNNALYGKRNYLKVKIPEKKYSIDSIILMTFICGEKTDVEITASPLVNSGDYRYIIPERENIFYIKYNETLSQSKQLETILNFYSYKEEDLIYEFHVYLGAAKIHIYTNDSKWNNVTNDFSYEYIHISDFIIKAQNEQNEIKYQKYFIDEYFNTINKNMAKGKTILFSIKPLNNFGFYLQINYDKSWVNVPMGKDKSYFIKNKIMYGYFDIYEEFTSIEMSINLKDHMNKKATIYLKLKEDDKIKNFETRLKHYEIPENNNYDYTSETDNYFGVMNININNIPIIKKEDKDKKIMRALFIIRITNIINNNDDLQNIENINNNGNNNNYKSGINYRPFLYRPITPWNTKYGLDFDKDSTINILITPGQNNYKRIDTTPYTFYFSNTSLIKNDNNKYDGSKEIKIYSLDKIGDKDTKMIIQINSCSGDYDIKISSKIVNSNENTNDIPYKRLSRKYGRKIFVLNNLKHKHIYLSIKPKNNRKECNNINNSTKCPTELSYLLHYYSATEQQYNNAEPIRKMIANKGKKEGQIVLTLPKLREFDYHNNYIDKNYMEYNLFWSHNKNFSSHMESICYLGRLLEKNDEKDINIIKNIQLNDKNQLVFENVDYEKIIYINVLARNLKSNELILYHPIKGIVEMTNTFSKKIFYFIAIFFLCIIIFISYRYYQKEKYNFIGYRLANNSDNQKDDIKYSNISTSIY